MDDNSIIKNSMRIVINVPDSFPNPNIEVLIDDE